MLHIEVEFKYNASEISLTDFEAFCKSRKPNRSLIASGFDHFYTNAKDADAFCRHRTGADANQLTFKRKTADTNNFVRTEHNIDLVRGTTEEQIKSLCSEFGYIYNSSLFKNCFIHKYDFYTLVYYVCYDINMKECGRFVEIEMSEEHPWANEQEALAELILMEKLCKNMGITPQARIKRSLYEMFKK